ncbi:MAG: SDR family NAD(P)-dependent oxidoreductase [Candidatus Binatia bacterium]
MDINGQVALITGASSGIGQRLAIDLAARGATVVGCSRSMERLKETADELKRHSPSSMVIACDVSEPKQVKHMVDKVMSQFGKIDVLVNNAGFGSYQSFAESSLEAIESMLRTNYLGTVYCTKEALPSMIARRSGHIVNISSVAGKIATPNMASYCATKFAQIGLSESLYYELRPLGIHVSVVCPGPVRTKFRLLFDDLAPNAPAFVVLDTAAVSRAVIRTIENNRFEIIMPRALAFLCLLKALMPRVVRHLISNLRPSSGKRQ